jgi:hypothetical protein
MKYENLHTYFKTRIAGGNFLVNFFVVIIIDIHQLNLGPLGILEFLVEN